MAWLSLGREMLWEGVLAYFCGCQKQQMHLRIGVQETQLEDGTVISSIYVQEVERLSQED